jgi:hypothetical protein
MNPIEAAKAILEAERLGEESYPDVDDKGKKKAAKASTSPKATNDAGTNAANGAGSAAGEEGEDNASENEKSVDMKSSDATSGGDQGSEASLAKGVKKKQKSDSGMTEDEDDSEDFDSLLDETEEEVEEEDTSDEDDKKKMKEHMDALFSDETDLSEDFRTKAETIFEAALNERKEELEQSYEVKLEESVNILRESLADKIDDYLSYVVEEWYTENKVALEQGLRSEIAENFIEGLKGLFEDNYIDVPQDKCNLIEESNDKVEELTKQLNDQIEKNVALRNEVNDSGCQIIFEEVTDSLTDTEVDKLRSLSEGLEYETQEQYKEKLEILKENYFSKSVSVDNSDPVENIDGSAEGSMSTPMAHYTKVLDRMEIRK